MLGFERKRVIKDDLDFSSGRLENYLSRFQVFRIEIEISLMGNDK